MSIQFARLRMITSCSSLGAASPTARTIFFSSVASLGAAALKECRSKLYRTHSSWRLWRRQSRSFNQRELRRLPPYRFSFRLNISWARLVLSRWRGDHGECGMNIVERSVSAGERAVFDLQEFLT